MSHASSAVERAALRSDAVDRLIIALRVHLPHDPAISRRVGAQPPIESAREHQPGHDQALRGGARLRQPALDQRHVQPRLGHAAA